MGTLRGQVKFHGEKYCGSPCNLLVISGVRTLDTLHASISANYYRHWDLVGCESQPMTLDDYKSTASNKHRIPLVCNKILPVSIVDREVPTYIKSRWLYFYLANIARLCLCCRFITMTTRSDTLPGHLTCKVKRATQAFGKGCKVMKTPPPSNGVV